MQLDQSRREFVALLGGAVVASPLAARAQQGERIWQIGVLMGAPETDRQYQGFVVAFREGLHRLGWVDGRNIRFDTRWAGLDREATKRLAKELVVLQPDLILSNNTPTTAALLQQTRTIPIIFGTVADPVGSKFVASLARPGGNATGFATIEGSLGGKWLEVAQGDSAESSRAAFVFNPTTAPYAEYYLSPFKAAAASFGVEAFASPVRDKPELSAIAGQAREPNGGLIVLNEEFTLPIAQRLHRWRSAIASLPSTRSVSSLSSGACCLTALT